MSGNDILLQESRTALHMACEKGHAEVAEYLLAHEADMEARDSLGNTPLHVATQHQQTQLVQILLDSGADPDSENSASIGKKRSRLLFHFNRPCRDA